jgi:hypothetical protein
MDPPLEDNFLVFPRLAAELTSLSRFVTNTRTAPKPAEPRVARKDPLHACRRRNAPTVRGAASLWIGGAGSESPAQKCTLAVARRPPREISPAWRPRTKAEMPDLPLVGLRSSP